MTSVDLHFTLLLNYSGKEALLEVFRIQYPLMSAAEVAAAWRDYCRFMLLKAYGNDTDAKKLLTPKGDINNLFVTH